MELLVVIAIIGILVALLLPAIQAAREAARRNACKNQLKQLALGCMNYESSIKHLPSGGWGSRWLGDADRGSGPNQSGGWIYNILPFIEQQNLHDMPSDGNPKLITDQQRNGAEKMMFQPFDTIHCPSRTEVVGAFLGSQRRYFNGPSISQGTEVPGTDYASNCDDRTVRPLWNFAYGSGNVNNTRWLNGPTGAVNRPTDTVTNKGPPAKYWATANGGVDPEPGLINGVIFNRSKIGFQHITDGTSQTYLIGEKWQSTEETDEFGGSNHSWSVGGTDDLGRSGGLPPLQNLAVTKDTEEQYKITEGPLNDRFGSPHASGFHMAFCDGHVESINYDIDIFAHQLQSNRQDGRTIQK